MKYYIDYFFYIFVLYRIYILFIIVVYRTKFAAFIKYTDCVKENQKYSN
ncbi:hypothetical protein ATF84_11376 [[Clostridium] innocuum]|nr:hypothetical protein ATF84_11376 [[Clostridium] innocuum]SSA47218.1 hypothetical protein SAMN04487929_11376 [[Clostridium] innocuum]